MSARIALVVNPCSLAGSGAAAWQRTVERLRRRAIVCGELQTSGDSANGERVAQLITETQPEIVVAAGGDGTVTEVVQGIMLAASNPAPALAIVPLGTANNVARSLGLRSFRQDPDAAVDLTVAAILDGQQRHIDLGQVGTRHFVGSFAIGMDADILVTRNRAQRRLRLGRRIGGYPLYLWSCAVNLLRHRSTAARLRIDGSDRSAIVYNLLVTNTPIYAGEFRFDADNSVDDGQLDLHLFSGPLDYLRRYPAAWRRHVRYARGLRVEPPHAVRRVRELVIELASSVSCQLDGEEGSSAASYRVRALPRALAVRVPA